MIIALGQGKSHGWVLLSKTKSDNYPNGIAHKFMETTKKANKPYDKGAGIKLDLDLIQLQLKGMREFYNDVVGVMDKHEVTKTDHELGMLMACKNLDVLYVVLILDKLKSNSSHFERVCSHASKIQYLTQSGTTGHGYEKEVHLPSVDSGGTLNEKCRN